VPRLELRGYPSHNEAFLLCRPVITCLLSIAIIRLLTSISLCGRLTRACAVSPSQRSFCLHSAAIAKSPGVDIVEYKRPLFQYPLHHHARNTSNMSSSEDDTPLVKAKDQGEFGDDIPRRHRRFHARRGLLSRDKPFPVSEAQASFQLHQRPPSSTTITLNLPPQSSWLIIPPPQPSQMTAYRKPKTKPWTSRCPQMAMSNRAFPFAWAQSTPWTLMRQPPTARMESARRVPA
jgi:hypothetical protein